jgi:hypothetical protein
VGSDIYRGDSWICPAAIHSGVLDDQGGFIIVENVSRVGQLFTSSFRNGIQSFDFNATYPIMYKITKPISTIGGNDYVIAAQIMFALLLSGLSFLGISRQQYFASISFWIYLYWGFFSADVVNASINVSDMLASFIPYCAVLFSYYTIMIADFLPDPSLYSLELAVLYMGGMWLGLYLDMLAEFLPQLPPLSFDSNMFRNIGSTLTLVAIFFFVGVLALYYLYLQRRQHQLVSYLSGYAAVAVVMISTKFLFGLVFHLHHYLTALMLLPITMVRNRFSLVVVGLLLGYYSQGVIKFGFDSPFDTVERAFKTTGRTLNTINTNWILNGSSIANGTLMWNYSLGYRNVTDLFKETNFPITSYSLVINDIEVYRGKKSSYNVLDNVDQIVVLDNSSTVYARVAPVSGNNYFDYGSILMFRIENGSFYELPAFKN